MTDLACGACCVLILCAIGLGDPALLFASFVAGVSVLVTEER
jgi:hypothetical protein